jgi:hypothetical protein
VIDLKESARDGKLSAGHGNSEGYNHDIPIAPAFPVKNCRLETRPGNPTQMIGIDKFFWTN